MPLPLDSILTHLVTHTNTRLLPQSEIPSQETTATRSRTQDATLAPINNDERLLSSRMEGLKRLGKLMEEQLVSPEEFTQWVQTYHAEESTRYRTLLCELKAREIDAKLLEIQTQWEAIEKNWPSRLSRRATEELLLKGRDRYPLLLLVAPPNISKSCPESIQHNLPPEIRNYLKLFLQTHYAEPSTFPVEFYGDYFNRDIFDIDVKQLNTVLAPIPTVVIYCDITDREVFFHLGVWGWPTHSFLQLTSPPWNWRDEKKGLEQQGYDSDDSLYQIRQQIVNTYKLLAAFFADWYYLNLDPNYEPRLFQLATEFPVDWLSPHLELLQQTYRHNQATVSYEEGLQLLQLRYPESAALQFNQALTYQPTLTEAAVKQGIAWYEAGQPTKTVECLTPTLTQTGTSAATTATTHYPLLYRGLALADLGQSQEALSCFEQATQLQPDSYRSWWHWAHTLNTLGQESMAQAIYEKANQRYVASFKEAYSLDGHTSGISAVVFSPNGQWLFSGSGDKTIKQWSVTKGREWRTLTAHTDFITSLAISADGQWLASGSDDNTVILWSVATGQMQWQLRGHRDWVSAVAFTPDGQWLASASFDQTIILWSVQTGQRQQTLSGHQAAVMALAISHDGQWLASGGQDLTIKRWSLTTLEEQCTLTGHFDFIASLAFSPDDQWLASGSKDHTIKLWSMTSCSEQLTLPGHYDTVWSVTFNPTGQWLASGSWDSTIKLWSVATGRELRILRGHYSAVNALAFSADSHWLASGSDDRTIKLWQTR